MSLILYINGVQVELEAGNQIAQTKQVNDLNSIATRQANYTNTFRLRKTPTNVKAMDFLSMPGNQSNVPYQKNECSLYSDTGECFVYKGWANITESSDYYNVNIYDGIIDLYKAIENKNLADLGLEELTHVKDLPAVYNSWLPDAVYRYILADYNGDTGDTAAGEVNIDYLVPSVRVSYLWNKIFDTFGFEYSGSVFLTENFLNLYMTFPKGINPTGDNDVLIFSSADYNVVEPNGNDIYYAQFNTAVTNDLEAAYLNTFMKPGEAGFYRIEIVGTIAALRLIAGNPAGGSDSRILLAKNSEGAIDPINIIASFDSLINNEEFERDAQDIYLGANDSLALLVVKASSNTLGYQVVSAELDVKLYRIDPNIVDFGTALIDFSIRDFMTEVVTRFGLTIFKEKYSNNYEFLTLQEQLQTSQVEDYSGKFSRKNTENYLYGSYAQRNWMRYNYNDKEASHYDSFIEVINPNLPDSKDVLKSKIYAPENFDKNTMYLNRLTNVYKIWDKEIVEDPEPGEPAYTYKPLDKRYYFLRAQWKPGAITLISKELDESSPRTYYYIETYYKLPFGDIKQDYYGPLQQIVKAAQVVEVELKFEETDIVNFDFKKLYYIEQLSSYFIMNKINNYVPGKVTKCEMVRVLYAPLT